MAKLFGTDGVRGVANLELTPEMAFTLGRAGSALMIRGAANPCFVLGRDPRISGHVLEAALLAGVLSTGANVYVTGVMTTPGVAFLTKSMGAKGGIVISASHNPFNYNGIKFFTPLGEKIPETLEQAIEDAVVSKEDDFPRPTGSDLGRVIHLHDAVDSYVEFLRSTVEIPLRGMKLVVDCANGAASAISPRILRRLGAEVVALKTEPDGVNINVGCGSLHPEVVAEEVISQGAHLGIAHDGDADRTIAVDENGRVLDGDFIMAIVGLHLLRQGLLPRDTIVATIMSNMGLDIAFRKAGGHVVKCHVGDRSVLEEMKKRGVALGGEQSGHIIFSRYLPTGDGIITAIQLAQVVKASGKPLSRLADVMVRLPQESRSVSVRDKSGCASNPRIILAIAEAEEILGDCGRVLVRPSGTEPVVRIMVEGEDQEKVKDLIGRLEEVVHEELS